MQVAPRTDSMVFSSGVYELRHEQWCPGSHLDLSRVAPGVLSPDMKDDGRAREARRVEFKAPMIRFQPGARGRRQHVRDLERLREWRAHHDAHLAVRRGPLRYDLPLAIRGPSRKAVELDECRWPGHLRPREGSIPEYTEQSRQDKHRHKTPTYALDEPLGTHKDQIGFHGGANYARLRPVFDGAGVHGAMLGSLGMRLVR